jgi:hypothetical protein
MENLPTQNNNPGDLKNIGGGFASFATSQAGYGALLNDIQTKINNKPNETLADFSNVYAPPSDNNNTAQYTADLANQLGVAPNTPISSLQPNIGKFAEAIASNEGYQGSQDETVGNSQSTSETSNTSFSPGEMGLGLLGMIGSVLPTIWSYAQKPLVDAAIDAGVGAIGGTAVEPGGGTLVGAAGGALTGIAQGIAQDALGGTGNTQTSPTTDTSPAPSQDTQNPVPQETGPTSAVPTEDQTLINNAINGELNRTIGGRTLSQSPTGQLGGGTMAENGYVPENNNGNADYSASIEHSQASESQAAGIEKQAAAGSVIPMTEVLATAQKNIESSNVAPDIKKKTIASLGEIASSYGEGDISGSDAIEARHQQYAAVKKDWAKMGSSEIEARKALGTAFRDVSLNHSNNHDLQRAAIFEQQKHISAQKVMKKLHNHPLSKKAVHPMTRQFLKIAAQAAETYIGEKIGGTLGAVLGYAFGSQINSVLEKKLKKTNFDTPEMKKALAVLQDTKPGAYSHFKETLKRNHIEIPDIKKTSGTANEKQIEQDVPDLEKDITKMQHKNVPSKGLVELKVADKGPRESKYLRKTLKPNMQMTLDALKRSGKQPGLIPVPAKTPLNV